MRTTVGAVFIVIHYPPYSAAANFPGSRGDPNLGPTPRPRRLDPLATILQRAYHESQQYPHAVFSAHAHHYERITYTRACGRHIPHIIVGTGGHGPIEPLTRPCEANAKANRRRPCPPISRCQSGSRCPDGDSAKLVAYNDRNFGRA